MAEQRYFVARSFRYGPKNDWLDVGQVTTTLDQPGDERLIRLEYFKKLDGRVKTFPCGKCGAEFVDLNQLNGHGIIRHEGIPESRIQAEIDAANQAAAVRFPLNTDKSEARRRATA